MWDDLEWPPPSGCGTQHPHRALGGTCVLLAAVPTTPPCFRHWRRSSLLHFGHIQRKNYFIILEYRSVCGRSGIPFSREGLGTNSLSQSLTALPAPSKKEPLTRPQALRFSRKLSKAPSQRTTSPGRGKMSPQVTKRGICRHRRLGEFGGVRPLRHRCAMPPLPKGEARAPPEAFSLRLIL